MKLKDLMTITTVAVGTATLTVLAFWTGPLEAGNEDVALAPNIAQPKLVLRGVELSLTAAEGRMFKGGDEPAFTLTAVNTTSEPAHVNVRITMRGASPADMLSRVPQLPSILWQQPESLALDANETRAVTVRPKTKLPANTMVSVILEESDQSQTTAVPAGAQALPALRRAVSPPTGIVAMSFSTAHPLAQLAVSQ